MSKDPFPWIFVKDLDPSILDSHQRVIQAYCEQKLPMKRKSPKVIQTPPALLHKHLTSTPISYWKAQALAQLREEIEESEPPILHCFENPGIFYKYSSLKLLVSQRPVKCYVVNQGQSRFQGWRWAVFEIKGQQAFHFDWKKWCRLPEVLP